MKVPDWDPEGPRGHVVYRAGMEAREQGLPCLVPPGLDAARGRLWSEAWNDTDGAMESETPEPAE